MSETLSHLTASLADRYRVERELGAGGMATVYLAHDVRHDRKVAIKVVHPELAAVLGAERFLSEIKTTAGLQHPHILPLFDSGQVREDGSSFLYYVMPYVEGESLRERLYREKQLPLEEAIRITREVADALGHAHARGVVHRDIKPENILLQSGHALVADFGIALAVQSAGGTRLTQTGLSLGTPQYMSPEQAMGERTLDARTDIYALGAVTFEMCAGEAPFTGPTAQAILAKVLTDEPRSLIELRKTIPPHVDAAVRTALQKLPADRFGSAAEYASALGNPSFAATAFSGTAKRATGPISWKERATIPMAAALVLVAAFAAWGWLRPDKQPPVTRTYVRFPDAEAMRLGWYDHALSRDGNTLVYVGPGEAGSQGAQLWVKRGSELHARPIAGTSGGENPFLSPDGAWIGFVADAKLKKVPVAGGGVVTLADATCARLGCTDRAESGAWLDDGHIAFQSRGVIVMVSEDGTAQDTLVTSADVAGLGPIAPVALPGSRGILFNACTLACNKTDIWVTDLRTRKHRQLVQNATFPQYSPTGHLLYSDRKGTEMAAPFDLASLELKGPAVPVLEGVGSNLALSATGTAIYVEANPNLQSELVTVGRDGSAVPIDSTWKANFATVVVSPDGKRVAASIFSDGQEHIWIRNVQGGTPSRITFDRSQNSTPTWTADGMSVLFTRFVGDSNQFLSKRANGAGEATRIPGATGTTVESFASRDGEWLVLRNYSNGARDIYARRTKGDTALKLVVGTPADDYSPAVSPNGKWLAYVSEETGRAEVWVCPFPDPHGSKWQVSTQGGFEPVWSNRGNEIFFVNAALELMTAEVTTEPSFAAGRQRTLFSVAGYRRHPTHRAYDVLPDDRHFVMIRGGRAAGGQLVRIENWLAELRAPRVTR